jgi:hypothetical protein
MCEGGLLFDNPCDLFCQLPEVPLSSSSELGNALVEVTLPVPEPQVEVTTGSLTQSHSSPPSPILTAPSHSVTKAVLSPNPVNSLLLLAGGDAGYPKEDSQEPLSLHGGSSESMPCPVSSLDDPLCHQFEQQTQHSFHLAQDPATSESPDSSPKVGSCLTYTVA